MVTKNTKRAGDGEKADLEAMDELLRAMRKRNLKHSH